MSEGTTTPPAQAPAQVLGGGTPPPAPNGAAGAQTPAPGTQPASATPPATPAATPPTDAAKAEADKKAADDKAAAEAKAASEKKAADEKAAYEKSWEGWKPQLPEGVPLDEATLKEFVPLAKETGLKPEQAQKFADLLAKRDVAQKQTAQAALDAEVQGWMKGLREDKEIGGAKWDDTLRTANKAFDKFADPELRAFLKATGLHAHPGLVRAFHKIGLAMKDDSIAGTPAPGTTTSAEDSLRAKYPSMFPTS